MGGMPSNQFKDTKHDTFDVDELVKKIDQKIAELEKEEALEKEQAKKNELPKEKQIIEIEPISNKEKEITEEKQPLTSKDNTDIKLKDEPFVNYTKGISDDQFFDDFFDE